MLKAPLSTHMDAIVTALKVGCAWHARLANELRKTGGMRGFARWHDCESACDHETLLCLQKKLMDYEKYSATVDYALVAKAEQPTIDALKDFQDHFEVWKDREDDLIDHLTEAIPLMRDENIALYEELCCIKKEVQDECFRLENVYTNLSFTAWGTHDITVKSKWLHDYFEGQYKGGCIDFNIG